jgi:hypothetical protein
MPLMTRSLKEPLPVDADVRLLFDDFGGRPPVKFVEVAEVRCANVMLSLNTIESIAHVHLRPGSEVLI